MHSGKESLPHSCLPLLQKECVASNQNFKCATSAGHHNVCSLGCPVATNCNTGTVNKARPNPYDITEGYCTVSDWFEAGGSWLHEAQPCCSCTELAISSSALKSPFDVPHPFSAFFD